MYDEALGNEIKQLLNKGQDPSLTSKANDVYLECIKNHLKSKKCPSFCSKLWLVQSQNYIFSFPITVYRKFCVMNKICSAFRYADEGLLIFSVSLYNTICAM